MKAPLLWLRLGRWTPLVALIGCIQPPPDTEERSGRLVRSNIERSDYVGSQECGRCHGEIHLRYSHSPMRNMTRLPEDAYIHAPFDGSEFRFKDDRVVLEERDGSRWMRIESPRFGNREFRVTKVIGGHHREDFAGVEPGGKNPGVERVLPVSYLIESGSFRYKGYSVMTPERPGLKPGAVWNKTCIFCHNTVPHLSTILGSLAEPGTPPYQGVTVDRLLPPERRSSIRVTDTAGLISALQKEVAFLRGGASAGNREGLAETAGEAVRVTREHFGEAHLIEVGIGCESCHGGSREHARKPRRVKTSLEPRSPFLRVDPPEAFIADRSQTVNRACARCHQVLFSRYPWTWEGGRRNDPVPGGAHINSGEARDLLLSDCRIQCTTCHDPHAHNDGTRLKQFNGLQGNASCLDCHGTLRDPQALRAHSRHDPAGPGGQCLDCHMPRKNMGLDTRLTRYHRIGSPTDPIRVEKDRPLECALCHSDKSVLELVETMESWWPHRQYDREALKELYGSLDADVLEATLERGKPHEQAVALFLAGRHAEARLAVATARQLNNPYPIVRHYADDALEEILGEPSPLDLHGHTDELTRAVAEWLKSAGLPEP